MVASLIIERARETLGTRTVWSASALTDGRARAVALQRALERTNVLEIAVAEPTLAPGESELATVAADDVVVLHDRACARLAEAVRERGAHAVLDVGTAGEGGSAVHAYVLTWGRAGPGGLHVQGIAALIPATGVIDARQLPGDSDGRSLGWTCLLADVVESDRGETVGGIFHPRPTVPVH